MNSPSDDDDNDANETSQVVDIDELRAQQQLAEMESRMFSAPTEVLGESDRLDDASRGQNKRRKKKRRECNRLDRLCQEATASNGASLCQHFKSKLERNDDDNRVAGSVRAVLFDFNCALSDPNALPVKRVNASAPPLQPTLAVCKLAQSFSEIRAQSEVVRERAEQAVDDNHSSHNDNDDDDALSDDSVDDDDLELSDDDMFGGL
jgi:hypothetical protein